jgi:hypothetical protein
MKTSTLFQILSFSGNYVDEKFHMETVKEASEMGLDGALSFFKNKLNGIEKCVSIDQARDLLTSGWAMVTGEELVIMDGPIYKSNCQFFSQKDLEKMISNGAYLVR